MKRPLRERVATLLDFATRSPLRCCVCIGLKDDELPEGYLTLSTTIINGYLVCTAHGAYAGPNLPLEAWHNAASLRGQRIEERDQRRGGM